MAATCHGYSRAWRSGLPLVAVAVFLLAGCGSKISEANYYRVQNAMDEEAVDDLLGPAHRESTEAEPEPGVRLAATAPADTGPLQRRIKTWSRGALTVSVVFERGRVVARRADGIPFEGQAPAPSTLPPSPPS